MTPTQSEIDQSFQALMSRSSCPHRRLFLDYLDALPEPIHTTPADDPWYYGSDEISDFDMSDCAQDIDLYAVLIYDEPHPLQWLLNAFLLLCSVAGSWAAALWLAGRLWAWETGS